MRFENPDDRVNGLAASLAEQNLDYAAACVNEMFLEPSDAHRRRLAAMRSKRERTVVALADAPALSPAGLRAKAEGLLTLLRRLDPAPEIDLAISLAQDVLRSAA